MDVRSQYLHEVNKYSLVGGDTRRLWVRENLHDMNTSGANMPEMKKI